MVSGQLHAPAPLFLGNSTCCQLGPTAGLNIFEKRQPLTPVRKSNHLDNTRDNIDCPCPELSTTPLQNYGVEVVV